MKKKIGIILLLSLILVLLSIAALPGAGEEFDTSPPDETQKLIFIHHSCGSNWLADDNGGLGSALNDNNYFVSDVSYGWGPNSIGDATDIPDWQRWFRSDETPVAMDAVYNEFRNNVDGWESYQRTIEDPGGENDIILFKSCYPNSDLWGNPDDDPGDSADWTIGGAKYVYNDLLHYFNEHPDKLFIVITAPPNLNRETAENARAFNDWLVNDWLMPYSGTNVAVWDFYAVLSHKDNHHRFLNGEVEHTNENGNGTAAYDSWGDPHPSDKGNQKATNEFIPLLNIYVNRWVSGTPAHVFPSGYVPEVTTPESLVESAGEEEQSDEGDSPADDEISIQTEITLLPGDLIDDFDGDFHWEAFHGETAYISCQQTSRVLISEPYALEITAIVPSEDWASCEYYFDEPMDFSTSQGLTFELYADILDYPFTILIYSGDPEEPELYGCEQKTTEGQFQQWNHVQLPWSLFNPVWTEEGKLDLTQVEGIVFAFGTDHDLEGTIAIENMMIENLDDPIQEMVEASPIDAESDDEEIEIIEAEDENEDDGTILAIREQLCGGILLIPFMPLLLILLKKKH